ncbi:MAG: AsmA family protein [Burkholderiaceae bacterium]|nr:AsmA family protein [Burkholderiaceae bacterium]
MKALRITLLALLVIVVVVVAAAAIFVATFDANRYKPQIEQLVLEQTGRTLKVEGNIGLTLFPNIGAELGRITLSDKDPSQAFVTLDATRVSVAFMPLLSGQVLVDGVTVDGLSANIIRDKGGVFNFADLMGSTEPQSTGSGAGDSRSVTSTRTTRSFQVDISTIAITNASIAYNDLQSGMDWQASQLNLKTGQIAPQSSGGLELSAAVQSKSLALNTKVDITGDYKLDLSGQTLDLTKLSTKLTGNWQDIKDIDTALNLNLAVNLGAGSYTLTNMDGKLKANLSGQAADLTIKTRQAKIAGTTITLDPSELAMRLKGEGREISSELKVPAFAFANDELQLKALAANILVTDPALGKDPLKVTASGDLSVNTKSERLSTQLTGEFDGSPIKATVAVAGFAKPAVTFDVAIDQLKLDRFAAAGSSSNKSSPGNSTANSRGSTEATSAAAPATASGKANAIDLAGLKGHNIKGKLRVGKVLSKGLTIDQVQADVLLNQGKLSVSPHSAQLFGGKLAGSLAIDANTNQFALKENISGIKLESLLTALGQEPKVTGQGSLTLDLMTSGTTVKALEQNLSGNASVNLKDGAVKGIDIGAIINNVRSMLGKAPAQQGTGSGETAFTDLTASATIQNGIATNRDLNVKAPLFRLEGAGTVNIPNSTVDYLAKVAVVETSTGQGGKDLAALRGVTIPIKISGKFDSPQYSVDVGSLAAELAKSQLGNKARDEINKVVPGLGDALKGLFGR